MFGHDGTDTNDNVTAPEVENLEGAEKPTEDTTSPAYITTKSDKDGVRGDNALPTPAVGASSDLLEIKQSALKLLTPLVGHLNQTPEEKFRTTMMMIQASDDQSLIKDAYAAAQSITDEKTKAQALLDIINEINYFTQQS